MNTVWSYVTSLFLFAGLLSGCSSAHSTGDGSVTVVDVNGDDVMVCSYAAVKDTVVVPLSDLVESCELVRFENRDEALFRAWWINVTDQHIGIRQEGKPYKLFDHTGKYLCDVGAIGQGPGEYAISIYDDIIDDAGGFVYLSPFKGDKIMQYGMDGQFIKDLKLPGLLRKSKISTNENGTLSVIHMSFGEEEPLAFQLDKEGKIIKSMAPPKHFVVGDYNGEVFAYQNVPGFDFMHTSVDTLFHYNDKMNTLQPVFTMAFPNPSEKPMHIYMELPDRFITNVFGAGFISSDKQEKTSSYIKVVNDYFGNMPVPHLSMRFNKGWFIYNMEPANLIEEIEKRLAKKDCSPEDAAKLNELLPTLDENNNNVMFIGKLKQ